MRKSEYKMVEFASTVSTKKSIRKRPDNGSTNVLSGTEESADLDELESYEPTEKIELEAAAVKDCLEKGKKQRNYVESKRIRRRVSND